MILAEETIEKAVEGTKEIAAKQTVNNNNDEPPVIVKRASDEDSDSPTKRSALADGVSMTVSTIPASTTTTTTFRVQRDIVPMIIGPQGERISQLQNATHTNIHIEKVVCSDSPNQQECKITGQADHVAKARELIQELIDRHNNNANTVQEQVTEQMLIPANKVGLLIGPKGATIISLKNQSGADMRINQANSCVTGEPKPLMIIGTKEAVAHAKTLVSGMIDSGVFTGSSNSNATISDSIGTHTSSSGEILRQEIVVPRSAVGRIIGRGGEVIKNIGRRTDCQINFKKDDNSYAPERVAVIVAKTRDSLLEATQLITNIVHSQNTHFGEAESLVAQGDGGHHAAEQGQEVFYMHIPFTKAGFVIGKKGETIRQINAQSGAYCRLTDESRHDNSERVFRITGTPQQVHHAKHLIRVQVGDASPGTPLPSFAGRDTTAYSTPQPTNGYNDQLRYFAQGLAQQQTMHHQQPWNQYSMTMQMPNTGLSNTCPQMMMPMQYQQQQMISVDQLQAQQSAVQPVADYSHQWAEYYRQLGMHDQAEAVEAAIRLRGVL